MTTLRPLKRNADTTPGLRAVERDAGASDERLRAPHAHLQSRHRRPGTVLYTFFFFFTLVTGRRRSLSLQLSDARIYEPQIRARLGTTAHFCEVVHAPHVTSTT